MDNSESQKFVRQVKCPHCGHFTVFSSENKYRPFCSERCKMIDLGEWASENYRVPTPITSSITLTDVDLGDEEQ